MLTILGIRHNSHMYQYMLQQCTCIAKGYMNMFARPKAHALLQAR